MAIINYVGIYLDILHIQNVFKKHTSNGEETKSYIAPLKEFLNKWEKSNG